jgi:hypothetical protein
MAEGKFKMKENDRQIEERLTNLGDLLRSRPSVTTSGMHKIKQLKHAKSFKPVAFMSAIVTSSLGLAACLLIGAFLWFAIAWPTSITLADVHKSIESKTWVLISYDDGAQEWANLRERQCFVTYKNDLNFYVGMRDHVAGIWRAYHSNWGEQIHEETFDVRPYPQTPWEYAIGDWDDRGQSKFTHTIIEKVNDTIDKRQVVRFDTYSIGPLELRVLTQQVWADPQTRLPVRIRKYSRPDEFKTGDFTFPETGPLSIYDLGAPQGLKIVNNWGVIEPAAKAIVNAAKEILRKLPNKMRIVEKSKVRLDIYYRVGNRLRHETYGKIDANNNRPLSIELPETNENIRGWAMSNLTLFSLRIYDGEYEYYLDKAPWKPVAKQSVEYRGNDLIDAFIGINQQWPYTHNVGPMWVLKDEPGTPPRCVLLRWEGLGLRRDWYVDPERDYICVKQLQLRKDEEGDQFIEQSEVERENLTRLSSGQWYARTTTSRGEVLVEHDVTLLTDSEIEQLIGKDDSAGFFDGEKLLKSALDKGINVTFWAR